MQARELPLSALRAFAAAARSPSLAAAAAELGVTHGAISKQINSLENWLGQRMFIREGRRLVLTPYGQILADRLGRSIDDIQGACEYVRRGKNQLVVAVDAPTTMAMYWLLPRLLKFKEMHPNIAVWTSTRHTGQHPDLSSTDIVITRGESSMPRLRKGRLLLEEQLTVVSSPSLLARLPIKKPADVATHQLIASATRPGQWEAWFDSVGVKHPIIEGGHRFDHLFVAIHAVRDGYGSIIAPQNLLEASFSKGDLIAPIPTLTIRGAPYFIHRTARAEGRHIALFTDWLQHLAL